MPDQRKTLIMKFGGGALHDSESFHQIAKLICLRGKSHKIVVVLSAMRGVTNRLIELAYRLNPTPPRREYDMLVSVGERVSISLLAMALDAKGKKGVSFTGSQSGVITTTDHTEARITAVRPYRILAALEQGEVAIVAGFQGVSNEKEITTLGRGGSDTTAVALAVALQAEVVEFYKDVPGICERDPKLDPESLPYRDLDYDTALEIVERTGGKIIHPRALILAAANAVPLHVLPFWDDQDEGTWIGTRNQQLRGNPIYESPHPTHCY